MFRWVNTVHGKILVNFNHVIRMNPVNRVDGEIKTLIDLSNGSSYVASTDTVEQILNSLGVSFRA